MEDIKGDASALGDQLIIPLATIGSIILLGIIVYCLFTRLSRAKAKVTADADAKKQQQEANIYKGDSFSWSS